MKKIICLGLGAIGVAALPAAAGAFLMQLSVAHPELTRPGEPTMAASFDLRTANELGLDRGSPRPQWCEEHQVFHLLTDES